MGDPAAKEPTMEEILASIRRIISEDGEPVSEPADNFDDAADYLEAAEPSSVSDANSSDSDLEHLLSVEELLGDDLDLEDVDVEVESSAPEQVPGKEDMAGEDLLDDVFDMNDPIPAEKPHSLPEAKPEMETNVSQPQPVPAAPAPEISAANAIESLVRSMIEPMINEWLETNLEGVVNAKVDAELQRVATRVRQALVDE
ncbi:MAG: DUF2497 domain-containing protein [Pseudomonadota bacterium]